MEQNPRVRDNATLAARACILMADLQATKDPRHDELVAVMREASVRFKSTLPKRTYRSPSEQYIHGFRDQLMDSMEATRAGNMAVVDYIENKYSDLYGIIQRAAPHLG